MKATKEEGKEKGYSVRSMYCPKLGATKGERPCFITQVSPQNTKVESQSQGIRREIRCAFRPQPSPENVKP